MKVLIASSLREQTKIDPLTAAAWFPWPAGSEIRVLTVASEITPAVSGGGWHSAESVEVAELAAAQPVIPGSLLETARTTVADLERRGLRVRGVVVQGEPDRAIAGYARDWGADLIVVGSGERSLLSRLLAGSVSHSVVQHAPCSVLVVKQSEEEVQDLIEAHAGATAADATL